VKCLLRVGITRIDVASGKAQKKKDYVAEEKPLDILVDKKHYGTIFCSPSNLKELALGHLLSEGILKSVEEIEELRLSLSKATCKVILKTNVDIEKRLTFSKLSSRVIRSACGETSPYQLSFRHPKIRSNLTVQAKTIFDCVNRLNSNAMIFRRTGGVHVAAIYDKEGKEKTLTEDVGRHNAVDKVIGAGVLKQIDFDRCFLALSGRLTSDIVLKAAMMHLPIVASLAAAIDSGVAVANEAHLTLVGFVRGNRLNIYTFPERILS